MSEVSVRYISRHLLTTIDLNWVVARIIAEFPDLTRLVIEQMHDEEQKTAAPRDEDGIVNVRERIHIYVGKNCEQRRRDLEKEAERHSP